MALKGESRNHDVPSGNILGMRGLRNDEPAGQRLSGNGKSRTDG